VSSVLGPKLLSEDKISRDEYDEIIGHMISLKLFAGHMWDEAYDILYRYLITTFPLFLQASAQSQTVSARTPA